MFRLIVIFISILPFFVYGNENFSNKCEVNGGDCQVNNSACVSIGSSSRCRYGICMCKFDHMEDENQCYKMKTLGQECEENNKKNMCNPTYQLHCKSSRCVCLDKYEPDPNNSEKCRVKESEKKGLEEACDHTIECTKNGLTNAHCFERKCKCYFDATTVGDNCLKQNYGDSCESGTESEKCRGTEDKNMECKNNVCQCKNTFKWNRNLCLKEGSVFDRNHFQTCTPIPKGKTEPVQLCKIEFYCKNCPDEPKLYKLCVKDGDVEPPPSGENSAINNVKAGQFLVLTSILITTVSNLI